MGANLMEARANRGGVILGKLRGVSHISQKTRGH